MSADYTGTSPYADTEITTGGFLDILSIRGVPAEDDDPLYTIEPQYYHRPDLLSYDLYGTPKYWWIFAQRNMDTVQDPVYDIEPGVDIYLPKKSNVLRYLGD